VRFPFLLFLYPHAHAAADTLHGSLVCAAAADVERRLLFRSDIFCADAGVVSVLLFGRSLLEAVLFSVLRRRKILVLKRIFETRFLSQYEMYCYFYNIRKISMNGDIQSINRKTSDVSLFLTKLLRY
jgi:hypothetical protein